MNRRLLVACVVGLLLATATVLMVISTRSGATVEDRATPVPGVRSVLLDGGVDGIDLGDASEPGSTTTNELTAAIYLPKTWGGPRRVVYLQDGGHTVCAAPDDSWPCASPADRTPSHLGYDYLGTALVEAGFVAVSISANATVGRAEVAPYARIVDTYDALLTAANAGDGPLGDLLAGHLDLSQVSLVGHSRGGDAVARYAAAGSTPVIPVAATVLLAPVLPVDIATTGTLPTLAAPTLVLTGTCDGDAGSAGEAFASATNPEVTLQVVAGANHNFYNTVWTPGTGVPDAVDDASGLVANRPECAAGTAGRLSVEQQHTVAADVIPGFLAAHQG